MLNVICATVGKRVGFSFKYGGYGRGHVCKIRPVQDSAVWYQHKWSNKLVVLPLVVAQNTCLVNIILLVAEIIPDNWRRFSFWHQVFGLLQHTELELMWLVDRCMQRLHAQCVSGSFEIIWVHLPPESQTLPCDYCTHRDDDVQTTERAALAHYMISDINKDSSSSFNFNVSTADTNSCRLSIYMNSHCLGWLAAAFVFLCLKSRSCLKTTETMNDGKPATDMIKCGIYIGQTHGGSG